jgi:hypothetical protein
MKRRFITMLSLLSLLLCIAPCMLWVGIGKGTHIVVAETTLHEATHWQFHATSFGLSSDSSYSLRHLSNWPEGKETKFASYHLKTTGSWEPDLSTVAPGSLWIETRTPDYWEHLGRFGGGFSRGGTILVELNQEGTVLRGPPFPSLPLAHPNSVPLHYWEIVVPQWIASCLFALLPLVIGIRWLRSRSKRAKK